jgi:ABC-2 type transport system permease protein
VQILVWPIGFLSSVFVDPASMPRVLGAMATWNPLSITASATRELFGSPGYGGETWIAQHAVEMAVVLPLVIAAIFLSLSAMAYRGLGR